MAAKKSTPRRPTVAQRKTAVAKKAGYTGPQAAAAQASAARQFGLVKNDAGAWVKPDLAFLSRQMAAQGWGEDQPVATPVAIGGARWMFGGGAPVFTGQRSDSAKRAPGAAYNVTEGQTPYSAAGFGAPGAKKKGKGKGKNKAQGYAGGSAGVGVADATAAAEAAAAFTPYAEADTTTTSYRRAQGKAYGAGTGFGLLGQTEAPPEGDSTVVEGAAAGGGGRRKKRRAKRLTTTAKRKSSPGGRKVTTRERKRIQRAKGK